MWRLTLHPWTEDMAVAVVKNKLMCNASTFQNVVGVTMCT
jgi:hypothetical protein